MEKPRTTRVLVVDDDFRSASAVQRILGIHGFTVDTAGDGAEGIAKATQDPPDLILLDVEMPKVDGFETARVLKSNPKTRNVPIIMVTGLDDRESRLTALKVGAEEFLTKPVDGVELDVRVRNLLRLKEYQNMLSDQNKVLEKRVAERTAQLHSSYRETIFTLCRAAEYKDEETGMHVQRISYYCAELSKVMGTEQTFQDQIFYASPMHDVGKIGIPDRILLKPGPLDPEEWEIMKSHTTIGSEILSQRDSPYLRTGAEIALYHHERWDGSGYPVGLQGENIPLAARIMNICDQYDALRSRRPYKPALDHETAVRIIQHGDRRTMPEHFDPVVLEKFLSSAEAFRRIYEERAD